MRHGRTAYQKPHDVSGGQALATSLQGHRHVYDVMKTTSYLHPEQFGLFGSFGICFGLQFLLGDERLVLQSLALLLSLHTPPSGISGKVICKSEATHAYNIRTLLFFCGPLIHSCWYVKVKWDVNVQMQVARFEALGYRSRFNAEKFSLCAKQDVQLWMCNGETTKRRKGYVGNSSTVKIYLDLHGLPVLGGLHAFQLDGEASFFSLSLHNSDHTRRTSKVKPKPSTC